MKYLKLKTVHLIIRIIYVLVIFLLVFNRKLVNLLGFQKAILVLGVCIFLWLLANIIAFIFNRCPFCAKFASISLANRFCPYCGEFISEDNR